MSCPSKSAIKTVREAHKTLTTSKKACPASEQYKEHRQLLDHAAEVVVKFTRELAKTPKQ